LFKEDIRIGSLTPERRPRFIAHRFFCHAFGIHPLWNSQDNSGFGLGFVTGEANDATIKNLNGLKNQLKLEKVRWHEDKMKAAFGEKTASDESAKEVWTAIMGLKAGVENELEKLRV